VVLPQIIRTDAALRPGTAGGAILDAEGRLVGMTTPGLLRGLPVAIPAAQAIEIAQRVADNRPLKRGYLGVSIQPVKLAGRQRTSAPGDTGLLVFALAQQGAAERAGVLVGDIIVRFNDRPLTSAEELQDVLAGMEPGTLASLALLRGEALETMAITPGERHER
jgi:S1-C subfamily serine protease